MGGRASKLFECAPLFGVGRSGRFRKSQAQMMEETTNGIGHVMIRFCFVNNLPSQLETERAAHDYKPNWAQNALGVIAMEFRPGFRMS